MTKQLRILGLDVSKASVSACLINQKPNEPRNYYYKCNFLNLHANKSGIKELLALKPDIAILEPTGNNYSHIWKHHLANAGVKVLFVGHKELRHYRAYQLNLPDKDDNADALALACYYFDYLEQPNRFVAGYDETITKIRQLVFRLEHLNRVQSPVINKLRQELAWQFPEVALVESKRGASGLVPLLWGWIAQERNSKKYDYLYAQSIGTGIETSTRERAKIICSLQRQEVLVEQELRELLNDAGFEHYKKVFGVFNFGERLQWVVIAYIYPIEQFLVDGKPEIRICRGRNSGKPTKHHLSLRRFQKVLGMAPVQESSGDKRGTKTHNGSKLCRKALWQWVFTALEPRSRRRDTEVIKLLCEYLDKEKLSGKPVRLIRSRVAVKAIKMLFRELTRTNESN
ncbi:MAG: transposase [Calothrix sp. FI2-JRJ7]|jgi:transposase|nr:transposase [Calothrix sp. FI2-JRJ7]MBW4598737.1 transposase [Calothrix sp. FI2-JRJ7]